MNDDRVPFARLVRALEPWSGEIVFIGGWAHRLFRLHPLAKPLDYPPLITNDADIAVPSRLPGRKEDLRQHLRSAGFEEELLGEDQPPVTHYRLDGEEAPFYAEFLTPLSGSKHRRDGSTDSTISLGGVTAQKLRYLEILLTEPWTVRLSSSAGYPVGRKPVEIHIPNAVSYIVQKLLVLPERRELKDRGKDLLYIHDAIEMFGSALAELRKTWLDNVRPALHANRLKDLDQVAKAAFIESSDSAIEAVVIARSQGRSLTVSELCDLCRYGFDEIIHGR